MNDLPTPVEEEVVFAGKFFQVVHQKVCVGDKSFTLEKVRRSPGTRLIIISPDNKVLLIREYRIELHDWDTRLPGGKVIDSLQEYTEFVQSGKSIEEKAKEAAKKEALEEVGLDITDFTLFTLSRAGLTVEWDMYYFVARDFQANPQGQQLDVGENITLNWVTFEEAREICLSGQMHEDRTVGVLLKFLLHKLEK